MSAAKEDSDKVKSKFVKSDIKIPSKTPGWNLDAWKYLPAKATEEAVNGLPIIVMAHGITGNKLMGLTEYAEAFAGLGYAVVVFDYRRWGTSDGTPRHVVYVSEQLDDYRTVVKYCRQQPDFDLHRVILWGTSFAGGHVVTLASETHLNLSAVISQCPYLGNSPSVSLSWGFIKTILAGIQDVLRQAVGLGPKYIAAVAHPGEVGLMTAPGTVEGFLGIGKIQGSYPNQVNASSIFEFPFYQPAIDAARITCPLKLIACTEDNLCPYKKAIEVSRLSPLVDMMSLPCGHFELYPGAWMFEQSLEHMKGFLLQRVPLS